MNMTAKILGSAALLSVGVIGVVACGDYATRNICFFNADPSCTPDFQDPTTPNIVGPNPNYPDPNVWKSAPGRSRLDAAPSKAGIRINEVLANGVASDLGQAVELLNDTGEDFDASGYSIRNSSGSFSFADGTIIRAGEFVVVFVGQHGAESESDFFAPEMASLDTKADFVALLSPKGMVSDFVKWGEAEFELDAYAIAEGQWLAGTQCRPVVEGASLAFATDGNLPTAFTAQRPSIGSPNK